MNPVRYFLALIYFLGVFVPAAAQPASGDVQRLNFHFEGGLLEQTTAAFLVSVLDQQLVPLAAHVNVSAENPAELAQTALKWPPGLINDDLSRALCLRNAHVCGVVDVRAVWRMQKKPADIQAEQTYPCGDANLPSFILCLPEIPVETYVTTKRVRANPELDNIPEKVVKGLRGCDEYSGVCKRLVEKLNAGGKAQVRDGVATMLLPTRAFQIGVVGDEAALRKIEQAQKEVVQELSEQNVLSTSSRDMRISQPPRLKLDSAGMENLGPVANTALRRMSHSTAGAIARPELGPVTVGVWDGYADPGHCLFQRAKGRGIIYYQAADADPSLGNRPDERPCGTDREFAGDAYDHASFVTSLIIGKNKSLTIGANPDAAIWQLEYLGGNLLKPDPITKAELRPERPDIHIINISQSFEKGPADVQSSLQKLLLDDDGSGQKYLFVAAAGNKGLHFSDKGPCNVIPACWSLHSPESNTIISVVALDAGGTKLLSTSNHGIAFDVAAIGETAGAVYGHAVARGSGTSFATPYVSALASLLYERVDRSTLRINPLRVKQRILFTSTFISGLESSVRFGRIDFARALAFSTDVLQLRPSACLKGKCTLKGNAHPDTTVVLESAYDERGQPVANISYRMKEIKRLQAAPLPNGEVRFWVVARKDKVLRRYSGAKIPSVMSFDSQPKIAIEDVVDYTSCSFNKNCDGDLR